MGVFKGSQEILDLAYNTDAAFIRRIDRIDQWFCYRAVHLPALLNYDEM